VLDLWRCGFIARPIETVAATPLAAEDITWLPDPGSFRFVADPFVHNHKNGTTVFVEYWDYRFRKGEIHYYDYDSNGQLRANGPALVAPFHLSYPYLIEADGALYMLPEANRSGRLTLYRCERYPDSWQAFEVLLDRPAIDATIIRHGGVWWMFYALPGPDHRAMRELYVACADSLHGPWRDHAMSPVLTGADRTRPGGNAFVRDGVLYLPVQDCTETYGGAINLLRIDDLTPETFSATLDGRHTAGALREGFGDGLHTLSGNGGVTCIDIKRHHRSAMEPLIKLQFKVNRMRKRFR